MIKMLHKDLINIINYVNKARDITTMSQDDLRRLKEQEDGLQKIAYSRGQYGANGWLLQGQKTGRLYVSRTGYIDL